MGKIHQCHTTLACVMGSILTASLSVWPSYTIAEFTSNSTTVIQSPMSSFETSLVGSLPSLGGMLGTMCAGMIIDGFGRKNGGLFIALIYLLSWVMMDLTSSTMIILIARFLSGISMGASSVHAPIPISEVADESIRGMLSSAPMASYCIGAMLSYFIWDGP
ncbi:unnamed protein product [Leptosia nina]|uniref:Major facilitator superfamily (MFS) profile domain-containing protein n=1 Tax=Leptosia nina TaxID=320188 RepID=A0AAV1J2S6_9NEOP